MTVSRVVCFPSLHPSDPNASSGRDGSSDRDEESGDERIGFSITPNPRRSGLRGRINQNITAPRANDGSSSIRRMSVSRMPNPDSSKSCIAWVICTNSRGVALKVFHAGRAYYSSRVRQSVTEGNNG